MYKTQKEILMGVRIPQVLKRKLSGYCAGAWHKNELFRGSGDSERAIEVMEENADGLRSEGAVERRGIHLAKEFGK